MGYADKTDVPISKSKTEIERLVMNFGATSYATHQTQESAAIAFQYDRWRVRFVVPMPVRTDFERTPAGQHRSERNQMIAYEGEVRRLWRAVLLIIKAKIESVDSKVETFADAFLPHIILPNGSTVADWLIPQLEATSKAMPPMLGVGQ